MPVHTGKVVGAIYYTLCGKSAEAGTLPGYVFFNLVDPEIPINRLYYPDPAWCTDCVRNFVKANYDYMNNQPDGPHSDGD